eukprot:13322857-Alexandrium_andersonii.AAC.1
MCIRDRAQTSSGRAIQNEVPSEIGRFGPQLQRGDMLLAYVHACRQEHVHGRGVMVSSAERA